MSDPNQVSVSKLKVTTLLNADELLSVQVRDGQPRVSLRVRLPDRVLTADVAAKSVRKVQGAIKESGPDGVAIVLQGVLVGDAIAEAGLSAQPKSPKTSGEQRS
jgi:hypothetical protein